ncbi:bacillithiol biosynthesis cysteine-adding enzyme BshC [Sporosarcina sp. BI001-red]|uniref:bacillithiol biosynthesis cysteine-adding enzyme BshC n=1 Tax=Sporosarcina sp. BI001-red TaxID=2282866 RepID=UPI000E24AD8A|nr:bacillithiol biosynthesis cysteine-adding enzyme BshC [Sporosarcina sp. BI001-red]REB09667.1 bacillithiol biosynthesis cysteine-adding enzyme BshC [Sporosarcina sp. BI001-red]
MEIASQNVHKSAVMEAYEQNEQFSKTFYDYTLSADSYTQRLAELNSRLFQRQELACTIRSYMEPFGISDAASSHLEELSNNGVVIVGGQQAGLLTGPLYSVHKAITVILLAKQQREKLGVPVIPVFWVAGEDHDLEEINHIFTEQDGRPLKQQYPERFVLKTMASDTEYDAEQMANYIRVVFRDYEETAYTKKLLAEVLHSAEQEHTFTRFFVRLMNDLFQKHGLLFIDSADKSLRKLESNYFKKLIAESGTIAGLITRKERLFEEQGFGTPIQAAEDAAHLFYVHDTGRVLLSRKGNFFVNEAAGLQFSTAELLEIAEQTPWLLSNNVATRPLMQDMVFPVLAFVGGPGEIAYWSLLKDAFNHFEMKMPILVPRISITIVTAETQHALEKSELTVDQVMTGEVINRRAQFLDEQRDVKLEQLLQETENVIQEQYNKIEQNISDKDLKSLAEKNRAYHLRQLTYLKDKAEDALLRKYAAAIRDYSLAEGDLYPERNLQERTYTPYPYLNVYGPTLIDDLLNASIPMNGQHVVIYL